MTVMRSFLYTLFGVAASAATIGALVLFCSYVIKQINPPTPTRVGTNKDGTRQLVLNVPSDKVVVCSVTTGRITCEWSEDNQ